MPQTKKNELRLTQALARQLLAALDGAEPAGSAPGADRARTALPGWPAPFWEARVAAEGPLPPAVAAPSAAARQLPPQAAGSAPRLPMDFWEPDAQHQPPPTAAAGPDAGEALPDAQLLSRCFERDARRYG